MSVENLITNYLETWTSAQIPKKTAGRGSNSNDHSAYGIKKLRELILELAVRGKLVPQDPQDEPASELLNNIAKEKARLVKEGKIKKWKQLTKISEEEKPFKVSSGWCWARLGEIFDIQDSMRIPINNSERQKRIGPYPYYGANGQVGVIDDFLFEGERILLAEDGGFFSDPIRGVSYIVSGKFWVNNHAHVLACMCGTHAKFWTGYFNRMNWNSLVQGMTRAKLNQGIMVNISLPTPPLAEQHRIVAKVDELMALCDQLEQEQTENSETHQLLVKTLLESLIHARDHQDFIDTWRRIEQNFDLLFATESSIDELKQTILQLAVMGKLVPQDPNDEPASELLKKIVKEKARQAKDSKIQKLKPLPPIGEDERPFELPNGWGWVRLGEISNRIGSGSTPRGGKYIYSDAGIPFLRSQNVWNHGLDLYDVAFITEEIHDKMENTKVYPGDVLLNITGASLGRCTVYPNDIGEANVSQHVTIIRPTLNETKFYLHLSILSPYTQSLIWGRQVGMAREGLSKKVLELFEIPLPPLTEQYRIATKVDELMGLCDSLKVRLKEAQSTKVQLADTVVGQATI